MYTSLSDQNLGLKIPYLGPSRPMKISSPRPGTPKPETGVNCNEIATILCQSSCDALHSTAFDECFGLGRSIPERRLSGWPPVPDHLDKRPPWRTPSSPGELPSGDPGSDRRRNGLRGTGHPNHVRRSPRPDARSHRRPDDQRPWSGEREDVDG